MSIEITGPKAYDYQYLATVYAALCVLANSQELKEIYLEKPGSEDIELVVISSSGKLHIFEVQVKSEAGNFEPADLGNILCHFPARRADNNLAQRLLDNPNHWLIAVSKARCTDVIKELAVVGGSFERVKYSLNNQLGQEVLASMALFDALKTSKLKVNRSKYCIDQSVRIASAHEEAVLLDKVLIWEQEEEKALNDKCEGILFKPLGIPLLQANMVLKQLLDLVKDGRTSQRDIAAEFKHLISLHKAIHPVLPDTYVPRKEEQQLIAELERGGVVYLKGRSFCGKSTAGLSIASHFTHKGYDYKKFSSVEDAERFLVDTNVVDRIAILDDPMDHHYQAGVSDNAWLRVQGLAKALPHGKKLIVTANNDVLHRLRQRGQVIWTDLTNEDASFTQNLLAAYLPDTNLSLEAVARIRDYITLASPDKLFQPGQLDYLVNNWVDTFLLPQTDLYEVAAVDTNKIIPVLEIRGELCVRLYRLLCLCCDVNTAISRDDLAYILMGAGADYPGIKKRKISTISFADLLNKDKPRNDDFPVYQAAYIVSAEWQAELDFLTKCGFIRLESTGYVFRHPFYFEAAKLLLTNLQAGEITEVCAYLKRGIGCLSVQNALQSVRCLQYIFSQHSEEYIQQMIIVVGFFATESIFPSVTDMAMIFLSGVTPYLSKDQLEEVLNDLSNYHFDSSSVNWHNGIPFRPKSRLSGRSASSIFNWIKQDEYDALAISMLDSTKPLPTAEEAWKFADHFRAKNKKRILRVNEIVLDRLLNYDEAFIRSVAGYQVFRQFKKPPEALALKALNDAHPFVAYQSIKGFMRGWPYYSSGTKKRLLPLVLVKLSNEAILVSATHLITQFGIGYAQYSFDWMYDIPDKKKGAMWKLWLSFVGLYFDKGPRDIRINSHRFISTVEEAEKFLTIGERNDVLLGWAKFLLRSTIYRAWDTTLFAVNIFVFKILSQLSETQRLAFADLFLFGGAATFTADSLRIYQQYWDELLEGEKQKVITLLTGYDPDNVLKAVVLTGYNCPPALSHLIIGRDDWQTLGAAERIKLLPRALLEKCISINYITHRYQNINGRDLKNWNPVLDQFLDDPQDVLCKIAVKVLADDLAFHSYQIKKTWSKPLYRIKNLLQLPELRHYIFDVMLEDLSETTCSNFQPLWTMLFKYTDAAFHLEARKAMASMIERIELHDNFPIVLALFGNEFFNEIPVDGTMLLMMDLYRKSLAPDEDILDSTKKMIADVLSQQLLRLSRTYDLMREFVSDFDPNNKVLSEIIENSRHDYFKQDKIFLETALRERNKQPMEALYIN